MKEEEFFAKLLATFRIEADEHLKSLSDGLIALEGDLPQDQRQQTIEHIFREAHSLKGAARAVNQYAVEKICQALENVLSIWKQNQLKPSPEFFDVLSTALDDIGSAIASPPDQETLSKIIQKLEGIKAKQTTISSTSPPEPPISSEKKEEKQKQKSEKKEFSPAAPKIELEVTETKTSEVKETFKDKSIRVSLQKMNQIFQEVEEMLMVKLIAQQQVSHLKQLQEKQRAQEKEATRLIPEMQILRHILQSEKTNLYGREAAKKMFAFLDHQQEEIKFHREDLNKLIKAAEQNTRFVEALIDTLLEDMKKVLMQPLNTLFETMPRMIRSIAHELGKEIHVEFQGGDIEVDRRILEEIKDPLTHLIRNAIDHGIESPQEREQAQKTSYGTIKIIAAESHGNHVALSIIDDGRGIDSAKLKKVAVQQGLVSQKEVTEFTEEEAIKLAFHSGISTSPTVTELSGRGLGLGIVSEKVDRLGGQVIVESQLKQGTKFTLLLPLTRATFRGIHITVAGQDFIMPTHNVKRVLRVKQEEIQTVANHETILVDHRSIPYIHLADVLGLTRQSQKDSSFTHLQFVILISAAEKTLAFGADDVHREQEVLVKGLGKQCVRVKNIMAATVMEWGNVIPILNPIDLIRSSIKGKMGRATELPEPEKETFLSKKRILLVEDSITTRLLLKNILETADYEVKAAVDGVEALEVLRSQPVDLLLTDVEMPRMDGFTLIERVKEMEALKDLPIIICTSRASPEDREKGIELGANAYLDKSRFTQQELINILKKLL